jgi:hypothetical protein
MRPFAGAGRGLRNPANISPETRPGTHTKAKIYIHHWVDMNFPFSDLAAKAIWVFLFPTIK